MISDELEAGHQRVSPAKYLAAWRRMSRSVASRVFSVSNAATRARNAASSAGGEPGRGRAVPPPAAGAAASVVPVVGSGNKRGNPRGQGASGDPQIGCDPAQGGAGSGPVELDRLAAELLGVVLAGHDRGSSRFPGRGRIQRVQDQGSRPSSARGGDGAGFGPAAGHRQPTGRGGYAPNTLGNFDFDVTLSYRRLERPRRAATGA